MSLDDRIRLLSETIIQEVRSPIESALHHLLSDVMKLAGEDRDQAVQSAVAEAAAGHQTSLAALREQADHDRIEAEALREKLEREHDEKLAALRSELTGEHETTVAGVRDELVREHEAKVAGVRDDLAHQHEAAVARVREELTREDETEMAALREKLAQEQEAAVTSVKGQLDQEHDATVARVRDELAREHDAAMQAIRDQVAHDDQAQSQEHIARTAAEVAGGAALTAKLALAEHEKHEAETRVAALERELEQARAETSEAQHAAHEAQEARQEAVDREHDLACSDRTLAAFRRLDEARSLTEVLRILADQAATEIGRVAVLLVISSRLRGWELRGLPGADATTIDVPVDPGTVFGLAIARGLPVSTSDAPLGLDGDSLATLLAAPPDRAGLAVPISVGSRVVAILYADAVGDRVPVVPSNWPEVAEILARHAGHCLEVLTISHAAILAGRVQQQQATPAIRRSDGSPFADQRREEESARRYARLLISELKLYNEAAVDQGREERNLLGRLGPEIERARRLYAEKVPAAVRQRVDCFDQEVVRTLAGGDPGLLGQT